MPKRKKRRRRVQLNRYTSFLSRLILGAVSLFFVYLVTLAILANRPSSVPGDVEPTGMSMHREEAFIEKMAEEATRLNEEYGIRPSVTIAQAILESNWGQSGLAQEEQNYFGIKGGSESPQYATNEYTDEWIEIEASFRSYDSWEESMEDYAKLLANGTAWDSELYHGVIEADHYVEAAQALQEAGYATDPDYSEKVISIVERYDLDRFDE